MTGTDSLNARNPFHFSDGTKAYSLKELLNKLKVIDDIEYSKYANIDKNDFSIWIHNELGLTDLAESIRFRSRSNAVLTISSFLREKEDIISSNLKEIENNLNSVKEELEEEIGKEGSVMVYNEREKSDGMIEGYNPKDVEKPGGGNNNVYAADNTIILEDAITKNVESVQIRSTSQEGGNGVGKNIEGNKDEALKDVAIASKESDKISSKNIHDRRVSVDYSSGKTSDIKNAREGYIEIKERTTERDNNTYTDTGKDQKIMDDEGIRKIESLIRRIDKINKVVDEQHMGLTNKNEEIRLLKKTIEEQKKEIRNYRHNLNKLIEENKHITSQYLKLKEKETYLRRLELDIKEKFEKSKLLFDKLNKIKEDTEKNDVMRDIEKEEKRIDHMIEDEEISGSNIPIINQKENDVEYIERNEMYDLESIEKEIDKLSQKIESRWEEFNLDLESLRK